MATDTRTERGVLWKQRFRAVGIVSARIARRAPDRGLVFSFLSGAPQLHAWDVSTGELRQLTHLPNGSGPGLLAPDSGYVFYLVDEGGSETGHYRRTPWEGGAEEDVTPDLPPYTAIYPAAISQAGNRFAFTPTTADGFPLYCVDLGADGGIGAPRQLHMSPKLIHDVALSSGGEIAAVGSSERSEARQYVAMAFDSADGRLIGELSDLPRGSVQPVTFSPLPDDPRLLARYDSSGFTRPLLWNPRSGERTDLALDELEGDVYPLDWSPDGSRILLCQIFRAVQQLYTYDLSSRSLVRLAHPGGTYVWPGFNNGPSYAPGGEILALWENSTHLPQLITLDGDTGALKQNALAAGETPPSHPLRSVIFRSSDGEEIQGWLGVPERGATAPFPTILEVHGGPHTAASDDFNPFAQAWLDAGFAYLTVNYRGSTTFGRDFQQKVWGDLGHWEVEDMVAARDWLVKEGIARPDAVFVTGASYGGYLTLIALGKRPDLWTAGMGLVVSADLIGEFQDGTDWSRGYLTAMMGGTPEEKPEEYERSSPITYVEHLQAPLLVIQGRNDVRCPARQFENYEQKARSLNKPIEVHWFDAGHGALSVDMMIDFQQRMLDFAQRVLEK